jgi:hypothetical protein
VVGAAEVVGDVGYGAVGDGEEQVRATQPGAQADLADRLADVAAEGVGGVNLRAGRATAGTE